MLSKRVLVVDDDAMMRHLLAAILKKHDYDVLTAENGAQAIARVATHAVDVVLLDVLMPDLNGIGVCRHLRRQSDVPILMASVLNGEEIVEQARSAGANGYLTKPFASQALIEQLDIVLAKPQGQAGANWIR